MPVAEPMHLRQLSSLTLALMQSARAPLLLLDHTFRVLAASSRFYSTFAPGRITLEGKRIFDFDPDTWDVAPFRHALMQTSSGALEEACCEIDLVTFESDLRRFHVKSRRVFSDDLDPTLLVTITDLTAHGPNEIRQVRLQQEKIALLREVAAHRAQIDCLCESVGVSISCATQELVLHVLADDGSSNPRLAAALASIVTERVMQALAQSYPHFDPDSVDVEQQANAANWRLRVREKPAGALSAEDLLLDQFTTEVAQAGAVSASSA